MYTVHMYYPKIIGITLTHHHRQNLTDTQSLHKFILLHTRHGLFCILSTTHNNSRPTNPFLYYVKWQHFLHTMPVFINDSLY